MEKSVRAASYKQTQVFGYRGPTEKVQDQDIISVLRFDPTGKCLALGDKAGRVIMFSKEDTGKGKDQQFQYMSEFQSHCREFDPLRSMDVDEEILDMIWLKQQGKYQKMLTTNTNTVKLWKIFNKDEREVVKPAGKDLSMPKIQSKESSVSAIVQKAFPQRHETPINSVGATANEQYLLTSDEIQVYLWSFQHSHQPYIVANVKKNPKKDDVKEHITCSKVHPTTDSLFVYGTDKGSLKLADMRCHSAREQAGVSFKPEIGPPKNFFSDYVDAYSSIGFLKGGRYIATRDLLTVKVWDVACSKKPVSTVILQESIKSKLCEMFENEAIFDKFHLNSSSDGNTLLTGTYNNSFHAIDSTDGTNMQYELNYKKMTVNRQMIPGKSTPLGKMDYTHKIVAGDISLAKNTIAVASLNCFFIYSL